MAGEAEATNTRNTETYNKTSSKFNTNDTKPTDIFNYSTAIGGVAGILLDPNLDPFNIYGNKKRGYNYLRAKGMDEILGKMSKLGETERANINPRANLYSKLGNIEDTKQAVINQALNSGRSVAANRGFAGSDTGNPLGAAVLAAVRGSQAGADFARQKTSAYNTYAQEQQAKYNLLERNLASQTDNADRTIIEREELNTGNYLDALTKGSVLFDQLSRLKAPESVDTTEQEKDTTEQEKDTTEQEKDITEQKKNKNEETTPGKGTWHYVDRWGNRNKNFG